jgi:hypothetical protein
VVERLWAFNHVGFFVILKTGFEMKADMQFTEDSTQESRWNSSSACSACFPSFTCNLPPPILRLGIGLAISCALLLLETGCVTMVEPAPSNTDQQASVDTAPVEAYQPPPPEVLTVYQSDLNPYGSWVEIDGYGQCWAPSNRPAGWEPYTVGYWQDTDYGWTWVAVDDEAQWGDVTYHYGRWYSSPSAGWVWIPGTTWAPAWVAWREGGGYCGWAPLPPQAGFGTQYSSDDAGRYVPANQYVYCDERYATTGRVDQHIVRNDVTIIHNTTNITNITYVNNHVVNQGMPAANVARATGQPVERVELATAATPDEARSLAAAGKPVIYSPPTIQQAEKQRVANPKTPAQNPKSPTPRENPQTPMQSAAKPVVVQSGPNPLNTDKGLTQPKEQKQVIPEQTPVVAKAKEEQNQTDAKPKAPADAKPKVTTDEKAKADDDKKPKPAADEKPKADDTKKPDDKPSGQ